MLRKPEAATVRAPASRGGPIFWIAGIGAALAAFWVSGGHALVRQTPFWTVEQPEGAVLSIAGVTSRVDASGATPVLFVDGEAVNDGVKAGQLPPLEIRVTGNDSRITRYTLGTSNRSLAPGERLSNRRRTGSLSAWESISASSPATFASSTENSLSFSMRAMVSR